MLNLSKVDWLYDPYPIGTVSTPFAPELYSELAQSFPDVSLFKKISGKYSLSRVNNVENYTSFLTENPLWLKFHRYVKSNAFIGGVFGYLQGHRVLPEHLTQGAYTSRFEFSSIPADGGYLREHTDLPSKVVTIVVSMLNEPWEDSWLGGTDILRPTSRTKFLEDYKTGPGDLELIQTIPFVPNQGVLFIKTHNSWHGVSPLRGPSGVLRKTLTINIERA